MSIVLKHTTRQNIGTNMYPDQHDGEPFLEIIENAKSRGFRFRYTCEGPSHGGIPGCSSDRNKKTFPAVRICNYQGYARIVVQLVTNEENPRLHPHSLVGKQCQNGICTVQCGPRDMTATFPNLGIQHVTKKNVANILEERYIAAEMQLSSINDGFPQDVQKNIKVEDRRRIAAKAQAEAKSIDLAVVRLMFIAYLPDSNGAFTIMLKPVISLPIYDSKAPNAATLKICRMDCNAGSACGGDEVYLLCDKVQKDDIQVRFFEENMRGDMVWEGLGSFAPTDVHRQFAIVFKTPPYRDQNISTHVNVQVQLRRKSDQEVSEARPFTYLPNQSDFEGVEKKKRKILRMTDVMGSKNVINLTSSHQLFAITHNSTGSSTTTGGRSSTGGGGGGGGGDGSYNNNTTTMTSQPCADNVVVVKQETPQNFPLDPRMMFASNKIAVMSNDENSQHQHHHQQPLKVERRFIEGTQIPLPQSCQLHSEYIEQKQKEEILSIFDGSDSDAALSPCTSATTDDVITSSPLHHDDDVRDGGYVSTISTRDMNDIFPTLPTSISNHNIGYNFTDCNNIISPNFDFFFGNIAMDTGNVAMATSDEDGGYMSALRYNADDDAMLAHALKNLTIKKRMEKVDNNADGMTLLLESMKQMNWKMMTSLMDMCANYDVNDGLGWNILHKAVTTNNQRALEILMRKLRNSFEFYIDADGNNCGHLACESDNDVILASLLRHHNNRNDNDDGGEQGQNYKGETMYHVCARENSTKCLKELFKSTTTNGDVNAVDHDGRSPLLVAIDNHNLQLAMELIVQHGATVDDVIDDDVTQSPAFRIISEDLLQLGYLLDSYSSSSSSATSAWWRSLPMSTQMAQLLLGRTDDEDDDVSIEQDRMTSLIRQQMEEILLENFDAADLKQLQISLNLSTSSTNDEVTVTSLLDQFATNGSGKLAEIMTEMTNLDCDVMSRWLTSSSCDHRVIMTSSPQVCVSA